MPIFQYRISDRKRGHNVPRFFLLEEIWLPAASRRAIAEHILKGKFCFFIFKIHLKIHFFENLCVLFLKYKGKVL